MSIQLFGIHEFLAAMQPNAARVAYEARCTARSVVYLTSLYTTELDETIGETEALLIAQCALLNYDKETLQ